MTDYLAGFISSTLSLVFIAFIIGALGYLVGGVKIKGIGLGTAGVLLIALLYGILASYMPNFSIGGKSIALYSEGLKSQLGVVSSLGTAMFVTAIGLIAGPKFFRTFNKKSLAYIMMGVIVIGVGGIVTALLVIIDPHLEAEMAVGLLTGALTSTPGLSAAKEVAPNQDMVVAGYGIAYIFGILGVVLFVQIMPKLLNVDIAKERESFVAANAVTIPALKGRVITLESLGFFPFMLAIGLGCIIGAVKIPVINFALGTSGGTLVAGLIIGHFAHIGPIDCRIKKEGLDFFRELGLVLFLIGAGIPGGVNFISNVKISYFIYGMIMTLAPMLIGFLIAKYVFKLPIFNNLGSITGGMTSTPALGTLIATAGTDEVASAYAATYPLALVSIVLVAKFIILFLG
ncbi:MAG: YidE/YbjL duplication [Treponemataceae bacterium]